MGILLLVVLVVLLVATLPTWRHSRSWGFVPSSTLGVALVVVVVLLVLGII
ncbi:DUF3309 family protein [Piscinibacter koreensis]|uniref:DUF3309 family protein n=1 Tax=Piscinibacter koreensis TaxID=2742824 RepID=A0A7Y6NKW8_9BURK|nr:DUF3309 family protein [Schlegelella koreensis]NUZ05108.1 DUF3309 family protein [Schlegelella koreensis]